MSTIGDLGCLLACFSMLNNYFGTPCTPDTLNEYLQHQPRGYLAERIAVLDSVPSTAQLGDTVGFPWSSPQWQVGARFAIGTNDSLFGELRVVSSDSLSGRAVITLRPASWPPGRFWALRPDLVNWWIASVTFSGGGADTSGHWGIVRDTTDAATVEAALRDSLPVLLRVRNGTHWVLADGMRPQWIDSVTARGTYSLADPLGAATLYEAGGNEFEETGIPIRITGHPVPGPLLTTSDSELPADFAIVFSGPAWLYVEDPAGRTIRFEPDASEYVSGLPRSVCLRSVRTFDVSDTANSSPARDVILIPTPMTGEYTVDIVGQDPGRTSMTIQAFGAGAPAGLDTASWSAVPGMRSRYRVLVSPGAAPRIVPVGVTGVEGRPVEGGPLLRAIPNPIVGSGVLRWAMTVPGLAELEVFDVHGRRVGGREARFLPAGRHEVRWSELTGSGGATRPGLYFVRLRLGDRSAVARIVVLGGR